MATNNKIEKLVSTDIISESMEKINHNFDVIMSTTGIAEFSLAYYKKKLDQLIEEFQNKINGDNADIYTELNNLKKQIDQIMEQIAKLKTGSGNPTITSFVFIVDNNNTDFSTYTPQGGSYTSPYPSPRTFTLNGYSYTWEDSPSRVTADSVVWMSKAIFESGEDEPILDWTIPAKMVDSSVSNVEWCQTNLSSDDFKTVQTALSGDTYNFGNYLKKVRNNLATYGLEEDSTYSAIETQAEKLWRADVKLLNGNPDFTDNPSVTYYMARTDKYGDDWTNWKLTKVKGEDGDKGESIFYSYVFTKDNGGHDLSTLVDSDGESIISGGSYSNPYPENTEVSWEDGSELETVTYVWEDSPTNVTVNDTVWMVKGKFSSKDPGYVEWSVPTKMADSSSINIEWCETEMSKTLFQDVKNVLKNDVTLNYGNIIWDVYEAVDDKKTELDGISLSGLDITDYSQVENVAEQVFRTRIKNYKLDGASDVLNIVFTDTPEKTYFMATTTLKNGKWSGWDLVDVKGEDGEPGQCNYYSYVFTIDNSGNNIDLSKSKPMGGTYTTPIPEDMIYTDENTGVSYNFVWKDAPENVTSNSTVWMSKSKFSSTDPEVSDWSAPVKMADGTDFNVEWCTDEIAIDKVSDIQDTLRTSDEFNFGTFLNAVYADTESKIDKTNYSEVEAEAEKNWRKAVYDKWGITCNDNPTKAYFMATTTLKNGKWSGWDFVDVKGEKGEPGTSISFKGTIKLEGYYTDTTDYSTSDYTSSNSFKVVKELFNSTYTSNTFAVIFKEKLSGDELYTGDDTNSIHVFINDGSSWLVANEANCETLGIELTIGYSMYCVNGHMLIWDGDSWTDVGKIQGKEGDSLYIKYGIRNTSSDADYYIRFATDDDVPTHIGTYIASTEDSDFDPNNVKNYTWEVFKGEDSFGYEYIYKATSTYDAQPDVPSDNNSTTGFENTDYVPSGWSDDPMPLSETNKYVWMCWRKRENGKWTDGFIGVEGKDKPGQGKAKLWGNYAEETLTAFSFYVNDGTDISSYFVTGGTYSDPLPSDGLNTYAGDPTDTDNQPIIGITWTDVPGTTTSNSTVWMIKATFKNNSTDTVVWSHPAKMADSANFNVEWCTTEISDSDFSKKKTIVESDTYNFGNYMTGSTTEDTAEENWRSAIKTATGGTSGLVFTDTPDKAYFMATCSKTNGVWSNWTFVDVKGEKGESVFNSYAYTIVYGNTDISGYTVSGGTYSSPIPTKTLNGATEVSYTWVDTPSNVTPDAVIWMVKGRFSSLYEPVWGSPQRMMDGTDFNIEWCTTELTTDQENAIRTVFNKGDYNFGTYLTNARTSLEPNATYTAVEEEAETNLRAEILSDTTGTTVSGVKMPDTGVVITDTPESDAYYMATTTLKNGVWSNWTFTKVKGESGTNGINGTSISRIYWRFTKNNLSASSDSGGYLIDYNFSSASISNANTDDPTITVNFTITTTFYKNDGTIDTTQGTEGVVSSTGTATLSYSDTKASQHLSYTLSMPAVDSNNVVVMVIERTGNDIDGWGEWSNPIVINRYLDLSDNGGITEIEAQNLVSNLGTELRDEVKGALKTLGASVSDETSISVSGSFVSSTDFETLQGSVETLTNDIKDKYASKDYVLSNSYFMRDSDGNLLANPKLSGCADNGYVYCGMKYFSGDTAVADFLEKKSEYVYYDRIYSSNYSTHYPKLSVSYWYVFRGFEDNTYNYITINNGSYNADGTYSKGGTYIRIYNKSVSEYSIGIGLWEGDDFGDSVIKQIKYVTPEDGKSSGIINLTSIYTLIPRNALINFYNSSTSSVISDPDFDISNWYIVHEHLMTDDYLTDDGINKQTSCIKELTYELTDFNVCVLNNTNRSKSESEDLSVSDACDYLYFITDQLSGIRQEVTANSATTALIASVKDADSDNPNDITAGIFATANKTGSGIILNADHITLNGDTVASSLSTSQATLDNVTINDSCTINCDVNAKSLRVTTTDEDGVTHRANVTSDDFTLQRGNNTMTMYYPTVTELLDITGGSSISIGGTDCKKSECGDTVVPTLKFTMYIDGEYKDFIINPAYLLQLAVVESGSWMPTQLDVFGYNDGTNAVLYSISSSTTDQSITRGVYNLIDRGYCAFKTVYNWSSNISNTYSGYYALDDYGTTKPTSTNLNNFKWFTGYKVSYDSNTDIVQLGSGDNWYYTNTTIGKMFSINNVSYLNLYAGNNQCDTTNHKYCLYMDGTTNVYSTNLKTAYDSYTYTQDIKWYQFDNLSIFRYRIIPYKNGIIDTDSTEKYIVVLKMYCQKDYTYAGGNGSSYDTETGKTALSTDDMILNTSSHVTIGYSSTIVDKNVANTLMNNIINNIKTLDGGDIDKGTYKDLS